MQVQLISLNIPQQIFTLFYAITWGSAANSLPRWKAFAWGAIRADITTKRRAWLSVFLLNVLPLVYFVLVLGWLSSDRLWNTTVWWKLFISILPAFAPFGFYRIWTAIVQWKWKLFYGYLPGPSQTPSAMWDAIGIELKRSDLNPDWASGNLFWGTIYLFRDQSQFSLSGGSRIGDESQLPSLTRKDRFPILLILQSGLLAPLRC